MRLTIKSVLRSMLMLGIAAVIGVTVATSATCGVGLADGTGTWCALPLAWLIGFPFAIIAALVFGLPMCAIPFWMEFATPFTSVRWAQSGFYDSLNYLGSGLAGGVAYWWICQRAGIPDGNYALSQVGLRDRWIFNLATC